MRGRLLAALAAAGALACGGGGEAPRDDARVIDRIVAHFQRANHAPGIAFEVTALGPSDIPGWRRGRLRATLGGEKQDLDFYLSADGRYLLRGEAVDLTVDPLAAVMARIRLDGQPARGPADAKVTIVEYSDFQCPHCIRAHQTLENEVLKEYGDRVRFVFKNLPAGRFHPWAEPAAIAGECARRQGDEHFWRLYEAFFTSRGSIDQTNFTAKVLEIAAAGGMDTGKLRDCMATRATAADVQADVDEATSLGIASAPVFIVNGHRLEGARTHDEFARLIGQELAAGQGSSD